MTAKKAVYRKDIKLIRVYNKTYNILNEFRLRTGKPINKIVAEAVELYLENNDKGINK